MWRGGAGVFAKAVLESLGGNDGRRVIMCDSYEVSYVLAYHPALFRGIIIVVRDNAFHLFDATFYWLCSCDMQGLPLATTAHDSDMWAGMNGDLAVSMETVRSAFARHGLLDDSVVFVKGYLSPARSHKHP